MTTSNVTHQTHRQVKRLKHPVGSTVIGTYQSRAGIKGIIRGSRCRVKEEISGFSNTSTKKYYDTEVLVEWEDNKVSQTRTGKVRCIDNLSQDVVERIKEVELIKRSCVNAYRREMKHHKRCK